MTGPAGKGSPVSGSVRLDPSAGEHPSRIPAASRLHPSRIPAASRHHPGTIPAVSRLHPSTIPASSREHSGRAIRAGTAPPPGASARRSRPGRRLMLNFLSRPEKCPALSFLLLGNVIQPMLPTECLPTARRRG